MKCAACGAQMILRSYMAGGGPVKYRTEKVWECPNLHPMQTEVEEWENGVDDPEYGIQINSSRGIRVR